MGLMIFRKRKDENQQEGPEPQVHEDEAAASAEPVDGTSVLTADVVLEGNLVTSGDLQLDGTLHGSVQARHIIIESTGAVSGHVVAEEVIIHGRVIGPICGVRVHLAPGAQVEGDVLNQSIVVEDGAFIDGQIRHSEDPLGEWQQMWYDEEAEAEGQEDPTLQHDETPPWLRTDTFVKPEADDDDVGEAPEKDEKEADINK